MSETNGVIRLPRKGRAKFEFDGSEGTIEVDVIDVHDAWYEVDWSFRDAEGKLPNDKVTEHGQAKLNFVQAVINDAYAAIGKEPPQLSRGEAMMFLAAISKEAEALRNFFSPSTSKSSSSPDSTEIVFSQ